MTQATAPAPAALHPAPPVVRDRAHAGTPAHAFGAWWGLTRREWVRFFRQRHRVVAAVVTPLFFWAMLGLGLDQAVAVPQAADAAAGNPPVGGAADGIGYLAFFYPGTVVLMVLFTAIFTTISVIEDRHEGLLQAVLVSPTPRLAVVLAKVAGGAAIAVAQGLVMLVLALPLLGFPGGGMALLAVGVLVVLAVLLTALGLCFAWPMETTAGFHAVMNLVLMPAWLLSGALFPLATAAWPLKWAMLLNPLTHGQALFTAAVTGGQVPVPATLDLLGPGSGPFVAAAVLLAATGALVAAAVAIANRPLHGSQAA